MKSVSFVFGFIFTVTVCATPQSSDEEKIIETVTESMSEFLSSIPDSMLFHYGINSWAEIERATAGRPIMVFTISNSEPVFTGTWRVPLIIDGEYRALFTVACDAAHNCKTVDFGAKILAKTISNIAGACSSSSPKLLRVYELQKDFLFWDDGSKGEIEYYPVQETKSKTCSFLEILKQTSITEPAL